MKRFAALLLCALCLCSFASAEEPDALKAWIQETIPQSVNELFAQESLLTTVGTAKVDAAFDTAVLSFELQAAAETVDEANALIMAEIAALQEALAAQGVSGENIWRKTYDVTPNIVYHNSRFTEQELIEGYIVDIVISVRLNDMSLIGRVIDAATQSGAAGAHKLVYERSNQAECYQTALNEAAKAAMDKAQKLAESCGMTLGELVSVTELSRTADEAAVVQVAYQAK